MSLLGDLANRAQAVAAQINPFDNGRTYNTVRTNGANYAPQAPQSVVQQAAQHIVRPTVQQFVNPISRGFNDVGALGDVITGNPAAAARLVAPGGGLGHQGGILGGRELNSNGAIFLGPGSMQNIKTTLGTGLQVGSNFAPMGAGLEGGLLARMAKNSALGAGVGAAGSAGAQLAITGHINPGLVAKNALATAAIGGAIPPAGAALHQFRTAPQDGFIGFRGQGNNMGSGNNMFGSAQYIARDAQTAQHFGNVSKMDVNIPESKIMKVNNDQQYTALIKSSLQANPGMEAEQAIPKYVRDQGFQAVESTKNYDPMGGVAIVDPKMAAHASSKVTNPNPIAQLQQAVAGPKNEIGAVGDNVTAPLPSEHPNPQDQVVQEMVHQYNNPQQFLNDTAQGAYKLDKTLKGGQLIDKSGPADPYNSNMVRTSEHTPFYRDFYAQNGKAPTLKDYQNSLAQEFQTGRGQIASSDEHTIYNLLQERHGANASLLNHPDQPAPLKPTPQAARAHYTANADQATQAYQERTMQEFGTQVPNVVSADEAKFIVPGTTQKGKLDTTMSNALHEPASKFAKDYYKQLLADSSTKDKPVLVLGGGAGAGKTSGLKLLSAEGHPLESYAAINDTNLTTLKSAAERIDPALASGRKVNIVYTYRDPVDAFINGNIPRGARTGRVVPINAHVATHVDSLNTIKQVAQKYKGNPNVTISVVDNSRGKGAAELVNVDFLKNKSYNKTQLTKALQNELTKAKSANQVTPEAFQAYQEGLKAPSSSLRGGAQSGGPSTHPNALGDGANFSRFTKTTIPASEEVSNQLKKEVAKDPATYLTTSNKTHLNASQDFLKNNKLDQAKTKIMDRLSVPQGKVGDQTISDAIATAKALDARGKAADLQAATDIYSSLGEHGSSLGQRIQAYSLLNNRTPEGIKYSIIRGLNKAGVDKMPPELRQTIDDGIAQIRSTKPGSPERELIMRQLGDKITQQIPRGGWRSAAEFWRTMLISGPQTVAKVFLSQPFSAAQSYLEQFPAAAFDATRSLLTGHPRTTAAAPLRGFGGLKSGLSDAAYKLRTNVDMPGSGGFVKDLGEQLKSGAHQTAFERKILATHGAIQKPVFEFIRNNTLARVGKAEAINRGLTGAQRDAFIRDYIANPPKDAYAHALRAGEMATNQQRTALGDAAKRVQGAGAKKGSYGPGVLIAPITRVPGAIGTNALVNYSGAAFTKNILYDLPKQLIGRGVKPDLARTISENFGKAVVGAGGVAGVGTILGATGNLTPAAAEDSKQAALYKAQGKPNGAVRIPGTHVWLSLNAMGPLGIELAMGGGAGRGYIDNKKGGVANAAQQGVLAGATELSKQPYVQGITGVGNALNNPKQYATSFANSLLGSAVPAFISQTATGTDSKGRAVNYNSPTDVLKARLPIARERIAASSDVLGGTVPGANPGGSIMGGIMGTIDAFKPSVDRNTNNPAAGELNRLYTTLGATDAPAISAPKRQQNINGQKVSLNDQQLASYTGASGQIINNGINQLLHNPAYQTLNDIQKAKQINNVIDSAHTIAKIQVLGDNPNNATQAVKQGLANVSTIGNNVKVPGLNLANGLSQQYKDTLTRFAKLSSTQRQQAFASNNAAQYQYDQANFANKKALGQLTGPQTISGQNALAKEQVGSNYSQEVRQVYGLSKPAINQYLNTLPSDQASALYQQLQGYGNALAQAGISKNKLTSGLGTSTGSRRLTTSRGTSKKASTALNSFLKKETTATMSLAKKASSAKVGKVSLASKLKSVKSTSGTTKSFTAKATKVSVPKSPRLASAMSLPRQIPVVKSKKQGVLV